MSAPFSHVRPTPLEEFLFGSAYYPEHWDAGLRESDPALFATAGWRVIRMAEFAWDRIEPEPGVIDLSLFDETIARFGALGVRTILCTPTATPPRWLTVRHPDIVKIDADGRPMQHGSRQHASHFSAVFREHSRRITRVMAEHFRDNPHVIGWQTDNELHCHFQFDHHPEAQAAFREFLHRRYGGDIGALNTAWGTAFWAQTYRSFDEVETPRSFRPTWPNPAQELDYRRFLTDGIAAFQAEQIALLRAAQPRWWITHNGRHSVSDYRGPLGRDLDFLSYDSYPFFDYTHASRAVSHAFQLDATRACGGNFVVMEQQSGAGGQGDYFHDNPEPGEMRRYAWAAVARGADGVLFFRERSCRFGAEEYWCGVLDHDNVPRRRFREAAQFGEETRRLWKELRGTRGWCDVAVAAMDFDAEHGHAPLSLGLPGPDSMAGRVHATLLTRGHAVGVVHPEDNLDELVCYFLPHLSLFDPAWLPALERFVQRGGTLVVGARSGTKDRNNAVVAETLPGVLRALVGATVEEYGRQNRPQERPLPIRIGGRDVPTELWYEQLLPEAGTEVLGTWGGRHLQGSCAVTLRRHGKGAVVYVGTYFSQPVVLALADLLASRGMLPAPHGPGGDVHVSFRVASNRRYRFLINHGETPRSVVVPGGAVELIRGATPDGKLELPGGEVAVLREPAV